MNDCFRSVVALIMWLAFALPSFSQETPPDEPSIKARIESLQDADANVRLAAAKALGEIGSEAVPELIAVLQRDAPGTQGPAIYALICIGPAAAPATSALVEALDHEVFHVRYWACQALAAIGPGAKRAVPPLIECLQEKLPSVRRHAAIALGRIGPDIGEEGVTALIGALSDKTEPVREDAVVALGRLGPFAKEAVDPLRQALDGDVLSARAQAAEAHWRITGSTDVALPVLMAELELSKPYWSATESLARMGPAAEPVVAKMKEIMEEAQPEVREAIEEALKSIETE